jgi:hypothetical protein
VKSGATRTGRPGLGAFSAAYRRTRTLLLGADGISVQEFLSKPAAHWLNV